MVIYLKMQFKMVYRLSNQLFYYYFLALVVLHTPLIHMCLGHMVRIDWSGGCGSWRRYIMLIFRFIILICVITWRGLNALMFRKRVNIAAASPFSPTPCFHWPAGPLCCDWSTSSSACYQGLWAFYLCITFTFSKRKKKKTITHEGKRCLL